VDHFLAIYARQSRFDFRGTDTGRKATEAKGEASVELFGSGSTSPLWREMLHSSNARSFDKEITDATVRQSMLDQLSQQLNRLNLPYFMPESEKFVPLPVVVD
jgi:hypothetical protein